MICFKKNSIIILLVLELSNNCLSRFLCFYETVHIVTNRKNLEGKKYEIYQRIGYNFFYYKFLKHSVVNYINQIIWTCLKSPSLFCASLWLFQFSDCLMLIYIASLECTFLV